MLAIMRYNLWIMVYMGLSIEHNSAVKVQIQNSLGGLQLIWTAWLGHLVNPASPWSILKNKFVYGSDEYLLAAWRTDGVK